MRFHPFMMETFIKNGIWSFFVGSSFILLYSAPVLFQTPVQIKQQKTRNPLKHSKLQTYFEHTHLVGNLGCKTHPKNKQS